MFAIMTLKLPMIRLIHRSASSVKVIGNEKMPLKGPKKGQKFSITKNKDGIVTIVGGKYVENLDIKNMANWEQIEAVKGVILKMGLVFSSKIERSVRKALQ
jgi:hypothetical protein